MTTPAILSALNDIGPCDVETLSGHINQPEGVINSLLVAFIRKGYVRCVNSSAADFIPRAYELTDKARNEYDFGDNEQSGVEIQEAETKSIAGSVSNKSENLNKKASVKKQNLKNPDGGKTKAERLRDCLSESGKEMTARELASATGFPVQSIGGLLNCDIKGGRVTMRKGDKRSGYYSLAETCKAPAAEKLAEIPANANDGITVPTSKSLGNDIYQLDSEILAAQKHLDELSKTRRKKGDLLLIVTQLEKHLEMQQ